MAGTILIDRKKSLPLNGIAFEYLVGRIAAAFAPNEMQYKREIYLPSDEQGMDFISLKQQGPQGFVAFYRAAERARDRAASEESFPRYEVVWQSLLDLLRADPRAAGLGSPLEKKQ